MINVPFVWTMEDGTIGNGVFVYDWHNSIDEVMIRFHNGPTWRIDFEHISKGIDIGGDVSSYYNETQWILTLRNNQHVATIYVSTTYTKTFLDIAANVIERNDVVIPFQRIDEVDRFLRKVFS